MNKFFRTTPTRRLLGVLAGTLATVAIGATIAIAAIGAGPVPRRESLVRAIHQGISAPAPTGVYARITFTDNLIDSGEIQGSDPLLTGGSGRLWWTGHHLRLEIQGDNGDAQVVVNGRSFWVYDPAIGTAYEGTLPAAIPARSGVSHHDSAPTLSQIQRTLGRLARHLVLSGADPQDIAGEPAYSVRVSPRHDNGLLGTVELAWDALHRAPLRVGLYARGDSTPVLAARGQRHLIRASVAVRVRDQAARERQDRADRGTRPDGHGAGRRCCGPAVRVQTERPGDAGRPGPQLGQAAAPLGPPGRTADLRARVGHDPRA